MIAEKTWYKIVDYENGQYKTLFHGVNKSRVLKFNEWLEADMKMVKDGTSKTSYMSGWHILPDYKSTVEYLQRFKNFEKKRLVQCKARNVWPKAHSRANVFLAQFIYIEGEVPIEKEINNK
jgi:hypothetical protein